MVGASLPALQWQRGRVCFAPVGAAQMLLDLKTVISHSVHRLSSGELLKSLKCHVFETVQSDGMEMDMDHVDFCFLFLFFFIFTS